MEAHLFSGIPPVSVSSGSKALLDDGDVGLPNSGSIIHVVHSIVGVALLDEAQCLFWVPDTIPVDVIWRLVISI